MTASSQIQFRAFEETAKSLGLSGDVKSLYNELVERYSEPHRGHHDLVHIGECLELAERAGGTEFDIACRKMAFWFHDAIYDISETDNEAKSAQLAEDWLGNLGCSAQAKQRVIDLVLASRPGAPRSTAEESVFHDIDYSVLGSDRPRYIKYMLGIQREYSGPRITFRYRVGRFKFLLSTRRTEKLFDTQEFRATYESKARDNINFELRRLALGKLSRLLGDS